MTTHFKIIIPCYNVASFIGNTIDSVKQQTFKDFECIIIDDASTDTTPKIIENIISDDPRFKLIRNTKKAYSHLQNIHKGICMSNPKNSDVIVNLDGDDRFYTSSALKVLNKIYSEQEAWLTYCSFIDTNGNVWEECSKPIPEHVYESNSFRIHRWQATHLRSYKFGLFKKIKIDAFISPSDGNFFKAAVDVALMMPMLEMAGHRAVHVSDILYEYNLNNPLSFYSQGKHELQLKYFHEITTLLTPYENLISIDDDPNNDSICYIPLGGL